MLYSGPSLAAPSKAVVVRDRLVVLDPLGDSLVKVIQIGSGRLERAFGRHGEGPGEFDAPWSAIVPPADPGAVWIYDLNLRRLTHVALDEDLKPGRRPGGQLLHLRADFTVNSPVLLADGSILSPGFFTDSGRLARFDPSGKLLGVVGTPPRGRRGVPDAVVQHAYQSTAGAHPDGSLVALATRHADGLEIYHADGSPVVSRHGPDGFEPVYTVRQTAQGPTLATGEDLRFGYIDLATTAARIYALYSGKTRKEAPGRANFGTYIHVYDWQGRLRAVWTLDAAVLGIAVDPAGRTLYALRHDPEPAVLAYALPTPG
ncbi:MAG: BF3164 family lipoprotein [Longimicrobiaceae bacterium]